MWERVRGGGGGGCSFVFRPWGHYVWLVYVEIQNSMLKLMKNRTRAKMSLKLKSFFRVQEYNSNFAVNSTFLISISLHPDGVNL